jgi:hypothetical protein
MCGPSVEQGQSEKHGRPGWSYGVAYQPDVAAALEQLRQDMYARNGRAEHRFNLGPSTSPRP